MRKSVLATCAIALAIATGAPASAALVFTEAMSAPNSTADWWEITNTGPTAVNLTGYKFDDNSFALANAVALVGVTSINVGESVVFLESSDPGVDVPAFRNYWTGSTTGLAGVQIGTYTGSGVSLSGTSGDGLILYDAGGAIAAGPVNFPSAAGADLGKSFDAFNPNFHRSQVGVFGAFAASGSPSDIGSPGTPPVPEPATIALISLGFMSLLGVRRSR